MTGRRKPYSEIGIARVSCVRCGADAVHQWQVCADGNLYRPVCADCDVAINAMVLRFMRDPDWESKIKRYRERQAW